MLTHATLIATLTGFAIAQAPPSTDAAYQLLGTWSCKSDARSSSTMTFTRNADGSIALKNVFATPGGLSGQFNETYRFNPRTARWAWTAELANNPAFQESGTAPPAKGSTWIFEGTISGAPSTTQDIRMIYTSLGDSTFRREFESSVGGSWQVTSASLCKRTTPHA